MIVYDMYKQCICWWLISSQVWDYRCYECWKRNSKVCVKYITNEQDVFFLKNIWQILWDKFYDIIASYNTLGILPIRKNTTDYFMSKFWWLPKGIGKEKIIQATWYDIQIYISWSNVIPFSYMYDLLYKFWYDLSWKEIKQAERNYGNRKSQKKKDYITEDEDNAIKDLLKTISYIEDKVMNMEDITDEELELFDLIWEAYFEKEKTYVLTFWNRKKDRLCVQKLLDNIKSSR